MKFKKGYKILLLIFVIMGTVFLNFSSIFNNNALEISAQYFADVAENYTLNKTYCSYIVEPKDDKNSMLSTSNEFYNLYGSFKESKANYVGAVNAKKDHSIIFKETGDEKNYSFIYVQSAGFSNVTYKNAWKHEYYPLQLMFKGDHKAGGYSFFYISESNASRLLEKRGLEKTYSNYESLLGTYTTLVFDGVEYEWKIANIYLETNYFYDAVSDVMGDFFLGYNKYPDGFKKESVYFLRDYTYQNKYYFKYINETYPSDKYDYSIGTYNIIDNLEINDKMIDISRTDGNKTLFALFLCVSLLFFIMFATIFVLNYNQFYSLKNCFIFSGVLIFIYFIYWMIWLISHNVLLFTEFFTTTLTLSIVAIIISVFSIYLIGNVKKSSFEVNI